MATQWNFKNFRMTGHLELNHNCPVERVKWYKRETEIVRTQISTSNQHQKLQVFRLASTRMASLPTSVSYRTSLVAAAVFMLVATMMHGSDALYVNGGLNGVYDGLQLLEQMVIYPVSPTLLHINIQALIPDSGG